MSAPLIRRLSLIAFVLTLALLIVVGVIYCVAGNADGKEKTYWPPLTMIYEVDGPVHSGKTVRETRRLDYRSATGQRRAGLGSRKRFQTVPHYG